MGYSKSKRAVRRAELYLTQIAASEGRLEFPSDDPAKLSYLLRTAIASAKSFAAEGEPFVTYAKLGAKYTIRVRGMSVVFEPRDDVFIQPIDRVSIPDVSDTLGIIGAAIKHKTQVLIFPDANAHTVDLARLTTWAQGHGITVSADDLGVRLVRV